MRGKTLQTRIFYPARLSFKFQLMTEFRDKKNKRVHTTVLQDMLGGDLSKQERWQLKNMNIAKGKSHCKGKYTINKRDQPLIKLLIFAVFQLHSVVFDSLDRMECSTLGIPGSHLPELSGNSSPLSKWYDPTISASVVLFSCSLKLSKHEGLLEHIGSTYQINKLEASSSGLPGNIQAWFLSVDWLIFLAVRGPLESSPNITFQKHHVLFCTQTSLWFNIHVHTWLLKTTTTTKQQI